ncbi:MAG: amidohydrolase [Bacteroidia bacterium]
MIRSFLIFTCVFSLFVACRSTHQVDLLVYGGQITSFGPEYIQAECLVIHEGKVIAIGNADSLRSLYHAQKEIDLKGKHVYPAWHDAHAHFASFGKGIFELDLKGKTSWEACLEAIATYINEHPDRTWVTGRGWDQNLWGGKYPDRRVLDSLYPDKHFYLSRVDGHAALLSGNVLEELAFTAETAVAGGAMILDPGNEKRLSGVVIDAAADRAKEVIPEPTGKEWREALLAAQERCVASGIAAITEAGLDLHIIQLIDSMQQEGLLYMKFITMLNPGPKEFEFAKKGIYETPKLKVASFKLYADGALGSRGALLKAPYCDHKGNGLAIHDQAYFDSVCQRIYELGFQANTHCIGDSANRLILETYGRYLKGRNDRRWRIEHAQVLDLSDISFFSKYSIVPSVQPTHATSDMFWAEDRLCAERMPGAYAYKSLLKEAGCLPLGTDCPVEDINPMYTLVSAVFRKNTALLPPNGFQNEEALSHFEALRGMTWWPAWAGFKENQFGGLFPGMDADFVIYAEDLQKASAESLVKTIPEATWIDGVERWNRLN